MFHRPRFRPPGRNFVPDLPPALRHAQQLMSLGRFEEAAGLFEQLARGAQERGLAHDARLFQTAGLCRLNAGQVDQAMTNFRTGLQILSDRGNKPAFQRACQRIIRELNDKGYSKEANDLFESILKSSMSPESIVVTAVEKAQPTQRGSLPASCPSCGGTLRADEVDWIDDASVECSWCGTPVMTDKN
jgi:tetratricopeptide (TPR) repeat protein